MDVVSTCPLRVASRTFLTELGGIALAVVCKATIRLLPGESTLCDAQDEPNAEDRAWDGDPSRSLHAPSDIVPGKARADVMLVGHAFAPGEIPAPSIRARLVVGTLDKTLEAFPDQAWVEGGRLLAGPPVAAVPLRYEFAAGGPDTWNPVGVRADAPPNALGRKPLPKLRPPGADVSSPGVVIEPIGFGPIAPAWPSRAALRPRAGALAGAQLLGRWWEEPLPKGLDLSFFNAAPRDQQLAEIAADERILLENLHPDVPRLLTRLPGIRPRAGVERIGLRRQEVPLRCDTLWIDTDRGVCSLVWRGQVELALRDEPGRVVLWMEQGAAEARPSAPPSSRRFDPSSAAVTAPPSSSGSALPFAPAPGSQRAAFDPRSPVATMRLPDSPAFDPRRTQESVPAPNRAPLPFVPAARPSSPKAEPRAQEVDVVWEQEIGEQDRDGGGAPPTPEHPEPPPMIGPLAKADPSAFEEAPRDAPLAEGGASQVATTLSQEEWPLERCAALAATIARANALGADRSGLRVGGAMTAGILEEHGLTTADWDALISRWTEEVREETSRGRMSLLQAYDRAYVGQLERERGPIEVAEVARLAVARERGIEDAVLAELGLPRGAMIRIERVWAERISTGADLGRRMREAMQAAREV